MTLSQNLAKVLLISFIHVFFLSQRNVVHLPTSNNSRIAEPSPFPWKAGNQRPQAMLAVATGARILNLLSQTKIWKEREPTTSMLPGQRFTRRAML